MPICPNCFYSLVLLSHRQKYKCAKCSKLFKQQEIDNREFRRWNEWQRIQDVEHLKLQRKPRIILSLEGRKQRARLATKRWRAEHRELCRTHSQEHYEKNKSTILAKRKLYRQQTKDQSNTWRKAYRQRQITRTQHLARIHWWRYKQKSLALHYLENNTYEAYTSILKNLPPTLVPYHLLLFSELLVVSPSSASTKTEFLSIHTCNQHRGIREFRGAIKCMTITFRMRVTRNGPIQPKF